MRMERRRHWLVLVALAAACTPTGPGPGTLSRVTPESHPFFPIAPSLDGGHSIGRGTPLDGTFTCESCHPATATSFADFSCTGCHTHADAINALLHRGAISAPAQALALTPKGCITCHPKGEPVPYAHTSIVAGECATCHAEATAFAALPKPGFTHRDTGGADCGSCHVTSSWTEVSGAPNGVFDVAANLTVATLLPRFSGTSIVSLTPNAEVLQMTMRHSTSALDAGLLNACSSCHAEAASSVYYPGTLHSALANLKEAQPTQCVECHQRDLVRNVGARPTGFVGPFATSPVREPASGEMRHEATAWVDGGPGGAALVPAECSACHVPPDARTSSWSSGRFDGGVRFHRSLDASGLPQPAACLDCHANSRPKALLTSMNAAVPAGLTFDHQGADTLGECAECHASTTAWSGARFHPAGASTPSTCLPCHAQERPTSTATWMQPGYQNAPFDYVTNDAGVRHGAGEDCVVCHAGPGSGAWGSNQNWQRGHFPHGPNTIAATTCLTCHTTQRPDLLPNPAAIAMAIGFDHRLNGTGECGACHQATVVANQYARYFNPTTMTLPGGDWQGGTSYPGDFLVSSPQQFLTLSTTRLTRASPTALITGTTTQSVTLPNAMKHTSAAIPSQLHPGPANAPNNSTCWHCHTHTNGTVTSFSSGVFHSALTSYAATPGGAVTALPQPTSNCRDCHAQMLPPNIVQRAGNALLPMDHRARFTSTVTIGGAMVNGVDGLDCSVCHRTSGVAWTDGRFHNNIGSATPQDCASCHYPLMASTAADVTSTTRYSMRHRSGQLTTQACQTCHAMSLSRAAMTPATASLWSPGQLHPVSPTQPTQCLDCHSSSEPATTTQGTVTYAFTRGGGSATNGGQWMSHTVASVVGRDCADCHASDAKAMGSAWSRGTAYHPRAPGLTQCAVCHGTANGRGATPGTNNNLPAGPTTSATVTTSSASPGVFAQMNHADLNATAHDCNFCHTQQGASTMAGVQGREWAQARFHVRFTAATPLVMNGSTARCSNCHLNEKPGPAFATFDHAAYTGATSTPDCGTCHSYPGAATPPTPNWRGAAAMPAFISVGGFTIPSPPAATAGTVQAGIASLPHPPVATGVACTSCHTQAAGGRRAFGYPHASTTLINSKCNACHEAGSDLVGTAWNNATTVAGGAGDTRPFTLTSVQATYKGNTTTETYPRHFFPIDCAQCHVIPAGDGNVTTGAAYRTAWRFPHTTSRMTNPSTCLTCHPRGAPD